MSDNQSAIPRDDYSSRSSAARMAGAGVAHLEPHTADEDETASPIFSRSSGFTKCSSNPALCLRSRNPSPVRSPTARSSAGAAWCRLFAQAATRARSHPSPEGRTKTAGVDRLNCVVHLLSAEGASYATIVFVPGFVRAPPRAASATSSLSSTTRTRRWLGPSPTVASREASAPGVGALSVRVSSTVKRQPRPSPSLCAATRATVKLTKFEHRATRPMPSPPATVLQRPRALNEHVEDMLEHGPAECPCPLSMTSSDDAPSSLACNDCESGPAWLGVFRGVGRADSAKTWAKRSGIAVDGQSRRGDIEVHRACCRCSRQRAGRSRRPEGDRARSRRWSSRLSSILPACDARDVEQVVDQPHQVPNLSLDHRMLSAPRRLALSLMSSERATRDRRERVAQLVPEHGQKLVLAPVRVLELFVASRRRRLCALAFTNVRHRRDPSPDDVDTLSVSGVSTTWTGTDTATMESTSSESSPLRRAGRARPEAVGAEAVVAMTSAIEADNLCNGHPNPSA